ncbi:MAG: hypothetical protein A4E24_00135 [Methanomethylovorans sp. PtaU1.Bin093]|jgi:hypothetical protein|uniref:hypothetical protein n=1 Tax=Methanomethylovorans sp. PtaU1.Bin093 TaxID=1811679 RepID=UPI0009D1D948|nr:hypothetical protein [Methanomethylovorans sp. PtaU1.Bin093]OPY22093.1 MAG: hypothetical protein A4E24_00135 [Methanomethylovorans sp. PtaU1.Bin093]
MNIIVTCYNCRKEFFAAITNNQFVRRCANCFKPNRVRTIIDGKARGEDEVASKLEIEPYGS